MADFVMPSLGADMDAGTLVAWTKPIGAHVERGEIIAEVETDKGVIAIESFDDGVLTETLVDPGTKVPVGTKLAVIEERAALDHTATPVDRASHEVHATVSARALGSERGIDLRTIEGTGPHGVVTKLDVLRASSMPSASDVAPTPTSHAPASEAAPTPTSSPAPRPSPKAILPPPPVISSGTERLRATPYAVRRAAELGVPLARCSGNGADGVIVAADVERAAALQSERSDTTVQLSPTARMRRAIGAAMTRSKQEIPHFYLTHTFAVDAALDRLTRRNAIVTVDDRVLPMVLLLRAVVLALRKFPELNGRYEGGAFSPSPTVDLGVAIALPRGGLLAPAIRRAELASLAGLMRSLDDLVQRSRSGGLTASELSSASITVTSLGDRGVESVLPIIHPPQVAMVGFGKIVVRPWVRDGSIVPCPAVTASLAADHRVSDGHRGGLFLAELESIFADPDRLFTEPSEVSP